MPAENQIILPTPVTKVRSIWPVLSNDKVKVKIRPLNKIVAHRGSETFEITTPPATSPTTTKSTTTTKQPQIDKSKIFKNKYEKTKNKLENFNEIKGKKKIMWLIAKFEDHSKKSHFTIFEFSRQKYLNLHLEC